MNHRKLFTSLSMLVLWPTLSQAAVSGFALGEFLDSVGPPTQVISGVGTSTVVYGVPCDGVTNCLTSPGGVTPANSLAYAPEAFSAALGEAFVVGTVEFFNGTIMPGTEIASIDLALMPKLAVNSDGYALLSTAFAIDIVNTPNTSDPNTSADFLSILGGNSELHVLESASATATLLAMFQLIPEANVPTIGLDVLRFGEVVSGDGFVVNAVPIPSALWLLVSALVAVGCRRRSAEAA